MWVRKLCFLLVVLCLGMTASAQRAAEGRLFLDVSPSATFHSSPSGGISFGVGAYREVSFWRGALSVMDYMQGVKATDGSSHRYDYVNVTADFDWMWRVAGSYSRVVNLYLGAGAFIGADIPQVLVRLPEQYLFSGGTCFIYGVSPSVLLEIYMSKRCALTLSGKSPFSFGKSMQYNHLWGGQASLGVRIVL